MVHLLALIACQGTSAPPTEPLVEPPPTERPWVDSGIYRPEDTARQTLGDETPPHTIRLEHDGFWDRSGDPYDALVGRLTVREYFDGYRPDTSDTADRLDCDVAFFLTGTPDGGPTCSSCAAAWAVRFTLDPASLTTMEGCRDPELPADGTTWRLALDRVEGVLRLDYRGSGVWLPWWPAIEDGDRVLFGWAGTMAVASWEER